MRLIKYPAIVYLKSAKLEQLILYLMHFNCADIVLRSNLKYTEVYMIVLKWNYCKYTSGTLAFKDRYYSTIMQSSLIVTLKHILGLILRNVRCAQVVLQIMFNYDFYINKSRAMSVNMLIDLNYT